MYKNKTNTINTKKINFNPNDININYPTATEKEKFLNFFNIKNLSKTDSYNTSKIVKTLCKNLYADKTNNIPYIIKAHLENKLWNILNTEYPSSLRAKPKFSQFKEFLAETENANKLFFKESTEINTNSPSYIFKNFLTKTQEKTLTFECTDNQITVK